MQPFSSISSAPMDLFWSFFFSWLSWLFSLHLQMNLPHSVSSKCGRPHAFWLTLSFFLMFYPLARAFNLKVLVFKALRITLKTLYPTMWYPQFTPHISNCLCYVSVEIDEKILQASIFLGRYYIVVLYFYKENPSSLSLRMEFMVIFDSLFPCPTSNRLQTTSNFTFQSGSMLLSELSMAMI